MGGRKYKVFLAQFGFYATVVAGPAQAAALGAWGIRQNLFRRPSPDSPTTPRWWSRRLWPIPRRR